jgi:hypothetical protein
LFSHNLTSKILDSRLFSPIPAQERCPFIGQSASNAEITLTVQFPPKFLTFSISSFFFSSPGFSFSRGSFFFSPYAAVEVFLSFSPPAAAGDIFIFLPSRSSGRYFYLSLLPQQREYFYLSPLPQQRAIFLSFSPPAAAGVFLSFSPPAAAGGAGGGWCFQRLVQGQVIYPPQNPPLTPPAAAGGE